MLVGVLNLVGLVRSCYQDTEMRTASENWVIIILCYQKIPIQLLVLPRLYPRGVILVSIFIDHCYRHWYWIVNVKINLISFEVKMAGDGWNWGCWEFSVVSITLPSPIWEIQFIIIRYHNYGNFRCQVYERIIIEVMSCIEPSYEAEWLLLNHTYIIYYFGYGDSTMYKI